MVSRLKLSLGLALGLLAAPVHATDIAAMSDAEREAFRAEIRNYLLDNPEVLMEAIGVLEEREQLAAAEAEREFLSRNAEAIYNDGFSYVGGNPEGDITLVEFLDYRCSYCRRAAPDVAELLETDGNIRWIVKEFPILGEESVRASQFAIATKMQEGDDAYGAVHDALMEHRGNYTDERLRRIAGEVGFDPEPVLARMEDDDVQAIIAANRALGQALQINGTPTFVMEDEILRGYVPLDNMRVMVRQMRASN